MAIEDPGTSPSARDWLEQRLRELARAHSASPVDEQELRHLVNVILHSSLLLGAPYTDERVEAILEGDVERALPPQLLRDTRRDGPSLARLRRLPDDVRAVGDQCLFDVGITGMTAFRGLPLQDLGVRAYSLAAEILNRLADDTRLKGYFDGNRLWPLPLSEEVTFLKQCARRFDLHAQLLRGVSLVDPARPADRHGEREGRAVPAPEPIRLSGLERSQAEKTPPAESASAAIRPAPPLPARRPGASGFDPGASARLGGTRTREQVLSAWERLLLFSAVDFDALRADLSRLVVGQPEAIATLCEELSLYATGTHDPDRPASYFFVGPTGVGKNHLVETLATILSGVWGVEVPYLLVEGPNYTDASDINELRGSTRGFIRSDEEGVLTEFHQRASAAPFSIVLVDEVEKAHPHLRKFFLSMMDRGTVTDNRGRALAFPGTMLVFTSNAGFSETAARAGPIGYGGQDARAAHEKAEAEAGLRKALSPEFMNRVKVVRFAHLGPEAIDRIFDLELDRIVSRYRQLHGLEVAITAEARSALIRMGTSWQFGARHLASVVDRVCNIEVARKILRDMTRKPGGGGPSSDLLTWLREIRAGDRAFNPEEVRGRVLDEARARLPYGRIEILYEPDAGPDDKPGDIAASLAGFLWRAVA